MVIGRSPSVFVTVSVVSMLIVSGCSSNSNSGELSSPDLPSAITSQELSWAKCKPDTAVECSSINVPADYSNPAGETFRLRVARLASTGPNPRLMMTDPGGPGIAGVDDLIGSAEYFGNTFGPQYTVVSWDPRGVGASDPALKCLTDEQKTEIRNQVSNPQTTEQVAEAQRLGRLQGQACQDKFPAALPLIGTANTARDMDVIRQLLQAKKVTYVGFSYGTFIGATYASMFGQNLDRAVLDSAMNPALDYVQIRHDQAIGFTDSISRFAADCLAKGSDCPLTDDVASANSQINSVVLALNQKPYIGSDGHVLSGSRALGLIESSMYFPGDGWPRLREVLGPALKGNYAPLAQAAYSPALMVNPADSEYLGVMCIDFQTQRDATQPEQLAPEWNRELPISGGNSAWSLQPCETWPAAPVRTPAPSTAVDAGPILIMNNSHDPATPLPWAQALNEQLAGSSLLVNDAEGHIVTGHNECVMAVVKEFLVDEKQIPARINCAD